MMFEDGMLQSIPAQKRKNEFKPKGLEMNRRRVLGAVANVAAAAFLSAQPAMAWPDKNISMIVPFAAGGPTDVIARIVGEHMSRTLGQAVIIENVAGAGGTTGITRGAQAKPDGHTIMMGHMGTHGAAPALYPNLKYDPAKDFEPVGLAAGTPILIVAKNGIAAKDLNEMIALLKSSGDRVTRYPRRTPASALSLTRRAPCSSR